MKKITQFRNPLFLNTNRLLWAVLLLFSFQLGWGQLSPGDIVIVEVNADGYDNFAFAALVDIPGSEVIKFTDNGWKNDNTWRTGEGIITWTAPSSGVACGTVVHIDNITGGTFGTSTGSVSKSGSYAYSESGDQLIAYQSTNSMLAAFHSNGTNWDTTASDANSSAVPQGLTDGLNCTHTTLGDTDNHEYKYSLNNTKAYILDAINNHPLDWSIDPSTTFNYTETITVTDCAACTPPNTQASDFTSSAIAETTATAGWTNGDGDAVLVVARQGSAVNADPVNGTTYAADAAFGSGDQIGTGNYVVYNGSGTSVSLTNLTHTTAYHFAVYAYNSADKCYHLTELTGNFTTASPQVDWCNVQFPTADQNMNEGSTLNVYAQVHEPGVTPGAGQGANINAWIGYSSSNSDPSGGGWSWIVASYNGAVTGDNDEYSATLGSGMTPGTYYYASRFQYNGGNYVYGGKNNAIWASNSDNVQLIINSNKVDWCNVSSPASATILEGNSINVYAKVYEPGVTEDPGQGAGISGWIGYSTTNDNPAYAGWTWVAASFHQQYDNNDEYVASIGSSLGRGVYYFASRFQKTGSSEYVYGGYSDIWNNNSGVLTVQAPQEIDVRGNSVSISNGDNTPDLADHTEFGMAILTGGSVTRTFTIHNLGDIDLTFSSISISGTAFSITGTATSPITGGSSTSFTVTFDPSALGVVTETVTINNNDTDEGTFTFSIRGEGVNYFPCASFLESQNFESPATTPELTYTKTTDVYNSSSLSGTFWPNGENLYASATNSVYVQNQSSGETIWFETFNTQGYNDVDFSIRIASFSGSSGNGADAGDYVRILVSVDGGTNYSEELRVQGNSNAYWSFNTGTATAEVPYDGDNTVTTFAPVGGGARTLDGYSTMKITGLPSVTQLKIKIWISTNDANEYWMLDDAILSGISSTTWNGTTWSNGVPTTTKKAVIAGDYSETTNIETCECQVNTGTTLTVKPNNYLYVGSDIDNNGTIVVEDDGSLIQLNDAAVNTGTGNYQIQKTTGAYYDYDYFYVSSPVVNAQIQTVFATADGFNNYKYKFEPTKYDDLHSGSYTQTTGTGDGYDDEGDDWTAYTSGTMTPGQGYIIMGSNSTLPFSFSNVTHHHSGGFGVAFTDDRVNNGIHSVPLHLDEFIGTDTYNFNLNFVGNPYPSAIDIKELYKLNQLNIDGNFYFWTHDVALAANLGPNAYDYDNSSFDVLNVADTGGGNYVVTPQGSASADFANISSGQGFMLGVKETIVTGITPLLFYNNMRISGNNNTFVKQAEINNTSYDRLWLSINNTNGLKRSIAVGFIEGLSDSKGQGDAPRIDAGQGTGLFSLIEGENGGFSIQLLDSFDTGDTVPLGMDVLQSGDFTIQVDALEGIFTEGQNIYLEDTYQDVIHNLSVSPYSFTSPAGNDINDRFILRFTNGTAGNEELELQNVKVYPNPSHSVFNISYQGNEMPRVTVFDLNGKVLFQSESTNKIDLSNFSNGLYFAKMQFEKGQKTVKLVKE